MSTPEENTARVVSDVVLGGRFTRQEAERIREQAVAANISVSALLRQKAITGEVKPRHVIPAINQEQWQTLARLHSNLNQALAAINRGTEAVDAFDTAAIAELAAMVREIRCALIGQTEQT